MALAADTLRPCVLSDISDTGARIELDNAKEVPDRFVLLLANNGAARRVCRVVWRKTNQIGARFEHRLPDSERATLVPMQDADSRASADESADA